jgi:hypothetical protein
LIENRQANSSEYEESKEGGLTVYDDDGAPINYMKIADLEEQVCKKIEVRDRIYMYMYIYICM